MAAQLSIDVPPRVGDVFAAEPFTGNSLVVVEGGGDLPQSLLLRIAREFNQPETTFVLAPTRPNADWRLRSFTAAGGEGCYVFSLDPRQPTALAYARFFNPTVGIWEDPATGTAAGPLAAHLVTNGRAQLGQTIIVEQGTAMGRTSLIKAEVLSHAVRISRAGVIVASGHLAL